MRCAVAVAACLVMSALVAGCDPVTERSYMDDGAGLDLYTSNSAKQAELQNQYIDYVCEQAGLGAGTGACNYVAFNATSWALLLQAGMNDIDQRCDSYLSWLDARRRDKEPVLAEIQALTTATHDIMTISGASPKALNIVTTAFGLGSATYTNWNNRLLVSVEQSTVQNVVYKSQFQYRQTISGKDYIVTNRPFAIYLLRNYLRLCMPMTIESSINTNSTLVSYEAQLPQANAGSPSVVVGSVSPPPRAMSPPPARAANPPPVRLRSTFTIDDAGQALTKYVYPNGIGSPRDPAHAQQITDFITQNKINASITFFLRSGTYTTQRTTLARQLKLIP